MKKYPSRERAPLRSGVAADVPVASGGDSCNVGGDGGEDELDSSPAGGEEEGGPTGGMRVRGSRGVTGKARRSKLVGGRTKNTADRHRHK